MSELRPYHPRDADDALAAWEAASRVGHPFLSEDFLRQERTQLRDEWLPAGRTTVALDAGGRVCGFLSMADDSTEAAVVGGLFVHPRRHGRGHGHALLTAALDGRERVTLHVFEQNHRARRFYAAHGFRDDGTKSGPEGHVEVRMVWERADGTTSA